MPEEKIVVETGGQAFGAWRECHIELGAAQAARGAALVIANPLAAFGEDWPFKPGAAVTIKASGDRVLTGFVDDYAPEFSADSQGGVISIAHVAVRSSSKDAIDCSAVHATGEWKNKSLDAIAKDILDPFGLTLRNDLGDLPKIPIHRLSPGATAFNEIEHLARQQGALLIGGADGQMTLTRADKFKLHAGALVEGVNIKRASARLSEKDKHSQIIGRGQKNSGSGAQALRLEQRAEDKTVERYRPLVIIAEGDMDEDRLKERTRWQADRAAGWSTTCEIEAFGWRDGAGEIWSPEKLIYVRAPRLKLDQPMALKQARLSQTIDGGTVATLSLVDPKALGGKDGKVKSNGAWSTGGEDE